MDFRTAANTKFTIGKYKGRTIDQVAETDPGLAYCDWALGALSDPVLHEALDTYLSDPTISRDLQDVLNNPRARFQKDDM